MNARTMLMALAVAASSLAACSGQAARPEPREEAAAPVPATSPLAKVRMGMTYNEVTKLLGAPTEQNGYPTGKAFIPFYFGNDARRVCYYYQGMGRVVFAAGNAFGGGGDGEVIRVEYDPTEPGHPRD